MFDKFVYTSILIKRSTLLIFKREREREREDKCYLGGGAGLIATKE
jgi:hypothetical protein